MAGDERKRYFVDDEQMDFEIQCTLGGCYYGAADAGEILSVVDGLAAGEFESWVQQWHGLAGRVRRYAEASAAAGEQVSAGWAYLRAASYFASTLSMIDGSDDPSRRVPYWQKHIECFDEFCSRLSPPAEKVEITLDGTPMPGYFFTPGGGGPRATIIFNNGSDGPTSGMWACGVAGALRRGYAALIFDGPGQNGMLWLHEVPFRYDWEKVITPVVDFLVARSDVDPERIALSGISQGGYWVLRALAFEHRLKAGIADPGVMDVFAAMRAKFPKELMEMHENGQDEQLDQVMDSMMEQLDATQRQEMLWRMKPYGADKTSVWLSAAERFNVRDCIKQIKCPMWIADPEDEQFWPGQSQEVYDALDCPKTIQRFTRQEGANWHCEPKARSLYDQRMFDWLATVMPAG